MVITICGSMKFNHQMKQAQSQLKNLGHQVHMPIMANKVDYWTKDNTERVIAKKGLKLIQKHMDKIKKSEAILVINVNKNQIENYIGANTFSEMIFAYYLKKKIYLLNPIPQQDYILDELLAIDPNVLNGDINKIENTEPLLVESTKYRHQVNIV